MRCFTCGDETYTTSTAEGDGGLLTVRTHRCGCGHETRTYEVTETVWNSAKRRHEDMVEPTLRKWQRTTRDWQIVVDLEAGMTTKCAAIKWGLSPTTIATIRQRAENAKTWANSN